ncbi:hypothetical protein SAY86_025283 [Trapa natans]|uniref:N-acetyltransferase ESCO acetyl-transferase domain-containing protein n=1 Tax=Trapa natans TaxID=22666 RepID=A0AAN7M0G5_TRANT|nr:hypothetical protein SAY86_025283 [Trapa natans]
MVQRKISSFFKPCSAQIAGDNDGLATPGRGKLAAIGEARRVPERKYRNEIGGEDFGDRFAVERTVIGKKRRCYAQLAFSEPTSAGRALASSYMGSRPLLVYIAQ